MSNEETKINSMEENYRDLQALIECLNIDFDKFKEKKVKAAGQRARNNLLNTKKLCDKLRKQILEEIRSIPVKHRISSDEDKSEEDKSEEDEKIEIVDTDKIIEELPKGANGPSEREVMEELGEIPKVITKTEGEKFIKSFKEHVIIEPDGVVEDKPKRKRKANKKKE